MYKRTLRAVAAITAIGLVSAAPIRAQVAPSKREAESMKQKAAAIVARSDQPSKQARRTTVTQNEVNAWFLYEAGDQIPIGVVEPSLTMLGAGRVSARAVVDLDAVRKANPSTGLFDPRNFLRGRLPVTAAGVLRTANGSGRLEFESASVGGVPIPKLFLQEIVSYYSRTAEKPAGISLDDAFVLPAGIRELQVEVGKAIVVQ